MPTNMNLKNLVKFLKEPGKEIPSWLRSAGPLGSDSRQALRYPPPSNKPYIPESPDSLIEPILLKEFQQWTQHRHEKTAISSSKASPPFQALETNIYANMLRSPPRLEVLTRTIMPSDLMIKLGITQESILTPLGYKHNIRGPKAYVLCSRKALEFLASKGRRYLGIAHSLLYNGQLSEVRRFNMKNNPTCQLREDIVEFYDKLMLEQIQQEAQALVDIQNDLEAPGQKTFVLTHDLLEYLPEDVLNLVLESLKIPSSSLTNFEPVQLPRSSVKLMTLLYRYKLYNHQPIQSL